MSYESRMLADLAMPSRGNVQRALLRTLLRHGGVVKEFAAGEEVVGELADQFQLNSAQRTAALETVYRKENRLRKRFCGIGSFFAPPIRLRRVASCPAPRKRLA
jgi:hypothetical protein